MLSRIANNLYWAGRYLERLEQTARFVQVNYFASLDGPTQIDKHATLENINNMAGSFEQNDNYTEADLLYNVAFDRNNQASIISNSQKIRENCNGARDIISSELWESVNRLYHFIINYHQDESQKTTSMDFLGKIITQLSLINANTQTSLIRNETWAIIELGKYVERSQQLTHIIRIKLANMSVIDKENFLAIEPYELSNLLKSFACYDVMRKNYKQPVDRFRTFEFLIFNKEFPRSLYFCITEICNRLQYLAIEEKGKVVSVRYLAEELKNLLRFGNEAEILNNFEENIGIWEAKLTAINQILTTHYFEYS